MWKVVALLALVGCSKSECPPQKTLAQQIVDKCGKPPRVDTWEVSSGLPGEGSAVYVAQHPEDYAKFTEWLVCTSRN